MSWKDTRLIDIAVDMVVYVGATHGAHAGKLSALLTTKNSDVYGLGMNTLVTNSTFNRDYPMQECETVYFSHWVKVEKLCDLSVVKIAIGFGWGAALTKDHDLLIWGTGATTYMTGPGVETVEVFNPDALCRFCASNCANYGRRIGNIWFSYCKQQQLLVTYPADSPPPPGCHVRRLGNRKYGALTCPACLAECDIEVVECHSFNYCNNCKHLWDLDESAMPLDVPAKPVQSFLRKLDHLGRIRDVTSGQWGFWALLDANRLLDTNRLVFSGFFVLRDVYNRNSGWWKQPLTLPNTKISQKIVSIHSNMKDVFVVTDAGMLYRRSQNDASSTSTDAYQLSVIQLGNRVKKMCCGRLASLCLLEDGTAWIIYSHLDREQTDAEQIVGKGANSCLDISGISNADLFYVHASEDQAIMKKKHPDKDYIVEVIFGAMNCKTFLWMFSKGCRVFSEGRLAYDDYVMSKLVKRQRLPSQHSAEAIPEIEAATHAGERSVPDGPNTSAGLGFPVGATLWWSLGSRLIQKAATGYRNLAYVSKKSYHAIRDTIRAKRLVPEAGSPSIHPQSVVLPPFQSGLYGKPLFSDLTIRLSSGNFHAHRIVLCSTSKYFKEKLSGANSDVKMLDMRIHNPRAYRCLLKYFYQLEPDTLVIKDMLDLLVLATTYDERRIAAEVEQSIKSIIDVDNVELILKVAQKSKFENLAAACEFFKKNDPDFLGSSSPTTSTPGISSNAPLQANDNG